MPTSNALIGSAPLSTQTVVATGAAQSVAVATGTLIRIFSPGYFRVGDSAATLGDRSPGPVNWEVAEGAVWIQASAGSAVTIERHRAYIGGATTVRPVVAPALRDGTTIANPLGAYMGGQSELNAERVANEVTLKGGLVDLRSPANTTLWTWDAGAGRHHAILGAALQVIKNAGTRSVNPVVRYDSSPNGSDWYPGPAITLDPNTEGATRVTIDGLNHIPRYVRAILIQPSNSNGAHIGMPSLRGVTIWANEPAV